MKTASKNTMRLLPVLGILLILAGYIYFSFEIVRATRDLKDLNHQKNALKEEIKVLESAKENLTAISRKEALARNDSGTIRRIEEVNIAARSEINRINKDLIGKINEQGKTTISPVTIFIQVNDRFTLERMKMLDLTGRLEKLHYKAYGYDLQEGAADNTIRYFNPGDRELAFDLSRKLREMDPELALEPVFVKWNRSRVPQGQVELWIRSAERIR